MQSLIPTIQQQSLLLHRDGIAAVIDPNNTMLKLLIPLIEKANNKSICINVPDFLRSAY
jgi:hypothetical protein